MSSYTLYTFCRSSTAWRARIALNLKQIKAEHRYVDLFKGEQRNDNYKKINPNTGVPSLVLPDGTILIESLAIMEYLNEIKPQPCNFYPGNPVQRAHIRGFCEVINSGIHPYQNLKLVEQLNRDYKADKTKWLQEWTTKGLHTIEALLKRSGSSGKYVCGEQITAADIVFYPQVVATNERYGIDISPFENIKRIHANLKKVKEFTDAQPKNQPDFKE